MAKRRRVAHTGGPVKRRGILSALAAVLLTVTAGFAVPGWLGTPTASATTLVALTGVTSNNNPEGQVRQYDTLSFTATWTLPNDAKPGWGFTLFLPPELTGTEASFELREEGGSDTLGTCTTTGRELSCTLGDYVESHQGVSGHIDFLASADQLTEASELHWQAKDGSGSWATPLPGGIIPRTTDEPFPSGAHKDVIQRFGNDDPYKGQLWWFIHLGGEPLSAYAGARELRFEDSMDERLTVVPDSVRLQYALRSDWGSGGNWHTIEPGTQSPAGWVSLESTDHGVTAVLHQAVTDGSVSYRIDYRTTPPAGVANGDTFTNRVTLNQQDFAQTTATYEAPDGEGVGTERSGVLRWAAKDSSGAALGDTSWTLTLADGTRRTITDNAEDDDDSTVGTLRVSGLAWGEYSLSRAQAPTGYQSSEASRSATISAGSLDVDLGSFGFSALPASLSWRAVDPQGNPLAGSAWEITGPGGQTAPVVDNGENDKDPAPGALALSGIAWGEYTLKETQAPAGYLLSSTPRTLALGPNALAGSFGDIVNEPLLGGIGGGTGPTLPDGGTAPPSHGSSSGAGTPGDVAGAGDAAGGHGGNGGHGGHGG